MELDITPIAITLIAVIGVIFGSKVYLNHSSSGSKTLRNKIKDHEEYEKYLKKQITVYKNKANNMEKGPSFDGEASALDGMLDDIVGGLADYAPKWLQPLLKDSESQKLLLKYVQDNPDKAKAFFSKMVGKKKDDSKTNEFDEGQSV